jgi:hypothetical protein
VPEEEIHRLLREMERPDLSGKFGRTDQ